MCCTATKFGLCDSTSESTQLRYTYNPDKPLFECHITCSYSVPQFLLKDKEAHVSGGFTSYQELSSPSPSTKQSFYPERYYKLIFCWVQRLLSSTPNEIVFRLVFLPIMSARFSNLNDCMPPPEMGNMSRWCPLSTCCFLDATQLPNQWNVRFSRWPFWECHALTIDATLEEYFKYWRQLPSWPGRPNNIDFFAQHFECTSVQCPYIIDEDFQQKLCVLFFAIFSNPS